MLFVTRRKKGLTYLIFNLFKNTSLLQNAFLHGCSISCVRNNIPNIGSPYIFKCYTGRENAELYYVTEMLWLFTEKEISTAMSHILDSSLS